MLHFEVNTSLSTLGASTNAPSSLDLCTLPPVKLKSGYALDSLRSNDL